MVYFAGANSTNQDLWGENMKVEKCIKESFVVIGKEGSTLDGEGFILIQTYIKPKLFS